MYAGRPRPWPRGATTSPYSRCTPTGGPARRSIDGVQVVHAPTRKYRGDSARSYVSLYGGFFVHAAAWMLRRPRARSTWCRRTPCPRRWRSPRLLQRLTGTPAAARRARPDREAVRVEVPRRRRDDARGQGERPAGHGVRARGADRARAVRRDDPAVDPPPGEHRDELARRPAVPAPPVPAAGRTAR